LNQKGSDLIKGHDNLSARRANGRTSFRRCAALTLALAAALPAKAEAPMTGADFEAYVTGHTMTYGRDGFAYAREEYLPGRRLRFAFGNDRCVEGYWYEAGDQICTVFEEPLTSNSETLACFLYFQSPEGLKARYMNDGGDVTDVIEVRKIEGPLSCPAVGA
jgi:hypothetical protein